MRKIVQAKYDDFCYRCGKEVKAGATVMWVGKKKGVYHFPGCVTILGPENLTKQESVDTI